MSKYFTKLKELEQCNSADGKHLTSFQRKVLLKHLQTNLQPEYRRRLEIMILADMGKSQTQICQILGCSQEMARYWIAVAEAGMAHKWNEKSIGRPKTANAEYIQRLQELVNRSPRDYGYSFQSWTAKWLSTHLAKEFGIEISVRHMYRLLKQLGLSTKPKNSSNRNTSSKYTAINIFDLPAESEECVDWVFNLNPTNK